MSSHSSKSVLLADFQFLTRKSLENLINELDGFKVIQCIGQNDDVLHHIKDLNPDILVLALIEEKFSHLQDIIDTSQSAGCEILILTSSLRDEVIQFLMRSDIKGVITKHCNEDEVVDALKSVAKGQKFVCKEITKPSDKSKYFDVEKNRNKLTSREVEVLTLIANGHTTQQIASKLHLSVHTINAHRKNILKKLNVSSPIHLIAYAIEAGLVKTDLKK